METDVSQVLELSQEIVLDCCLFAENQVAVKLKILFSQALWKVWKDRLAFVFQIVNGLWELFA